MNIFTKKDGAAPALALDALLAAVDAKIDGRHVVTLWPWAGGVMASLGKADADGNVSPVTTCGGATSADALNKLIAQAANAEVSHTADRKD